MPNIELVALFDFERLNSEQYPEDERYGEGSIKILVDKEPKTQEEFDEITKAIFRNGQFAKVALKHVLHDDDGLFSNLGAPGQEVDDSYVIDQSGEAGVLTEGEPDVIAGEIVDE